MNIPCFEAFGDGVQYISYDGKMVYRKFSDDGKVVATVTRFTSEHHPSHEVQIQEELDRQLSQFDRGEDNGN